MVDHVIPELNQKSKLLEEAFELVPVDIRFDEMVHEADATEAVTVCLRQLAECDLGKVLQPMTSYFYFQIL